MQENVPSVPQYNDQEQIRRAKLQKLMESDQNPYTITRCDVTHSSAQIHAGADALLEKTVSIAGRMLSRRVMGKASFAHLLDGQGDIQIYVRRDDVGVSEYAAFKDYDIGDVLAVTGFVFRTMTGEVSVHAKSVTLLTKCLKVLPEKFHGLSDPDLRYRQRYVDMIINPDVRETFRRRSSMNSAIREYLDARGFLEVDTPILHTLEIGAAARPFKTHHNTLDIDMYLRIETELYLKRLIVGGFERVYELGRIFRNEGMDTRHNPEFTSLELYQAYADYNDIMRLVENLYAYVAQRVCGSETIPYGDQTICLTPPWTRITMADAVKQYAGVDWLVWQTDEQARACLAEKNVHCEATATRGDCLAALFDEYVEHELVQPTFITDYPVEISPLAKRKKDNPRLTERFEYFIVGGEFGNAFSELNDPLDQRARFEKQVALRRALGTDAQVDEDFLNALEVGLPPTGGLGIGIDRMCMLLTNSQSIRDVLLFPTMKPMK